MAVTKYTTKHLLETVETAQLALGEAVDLLGHAETFIKAIDAGKSGSADSTALMKASFLLIEAARQEVTDLRASCDDVLKGYTAA